MAQARYLVGDIRERLADLEDDSVDLIMTSPPFLALRSYLPADHPDKGKEIGAEPDPGTFIDVMAQLVDDLARVLAPHGSMVFEFGDTFAGSGGAGGDYNEDGLRAGQPKFRQGNPSVSPDGESGHYAGRQLRPFGPNAGSGWPRAKSLALVPEIFRFSLAYGFNPLTGTVWWTGDDRWVVRNVVRWVRPNPPVGALGDKFRPATSDLAVFTRDPRRWFDLDAVRTPHLPGDPRDRILADGSRYRRGLKGRVGTDGEDNPSSSGNNPAGAPPLDWWKITTAGYPGSHYAVYPPELCVIPIKSMCPEKVCVVCGEPSRRIVTAERISEPDDSTRNQQAQEAQLGLNHPPENGWEYSRTTVGWSDCGHNQWRTGLVLDPFAGSGTTLAVATGHGRDAIGIDLDSRNADLAEHRIGGLFLTVEP